MDQIQRIQYMEQILDKTTAAVHTLSDLLPQVEELIAYYQNGQWLEDYEADEAGLLPAELKRGVLSQDTVYRLLTDYDRLVTESARVLHEEQNP